MLHTKTRGSIGKSTKKMTLSRWGGDFRLKYVYRKIVGICQCAAVVALRLQVAKLCTGLLVDWALFYILIFGIYGKFTRKNKMVVLSVCLTQIWSASLSTARRPERCPQVYCVKIPFTLPLTIFFISTTTNLNSMDCLLNWIPLRIKT